MTYPVLSAGSAAPYFLQRSLRLRAAAAGSIYRAFPSAGNVTKWTFSMWFKRSTVNSTQSLFSYNSGGNYMQLSLNTDVFQWDQVVGGTTVQARKITNQVMRDIGSWYHLVLVWDSGNATASSRMLMYLNGVQITAFSSNVDPVLNTGSFINSALTHNIGTIASLNTQLFDGYIAEINFVNNLALAPSSFGEYNSYGVWSPKKYVGAYGTTGFYLNFQDNSGATATTIGKDSSGNGNNWTPNNISVTAGTTYDSMTDVPTLTSSTIANYPTLNSIGPGTAGGTYSNANLNFVSGVASQWRSGISTMFLPSGKFYFEATIQVLGANNFLMIGACGIQTNATVYGNYTGLAANGWSVQCNGTTGGTKYNNGAGTSVSNATFANWLVNDILQCAVDVTNGRIWFGKNNTWLEGVPSAGTGASFTNLTGPIAPSVSCFSNTGAQLAINFGQRPFTYTAPTGFGSPLNAYNLPTPSISNGAVQFAATLYTGNDATQSITNNVLSASFRPDFVWIKSRSAATSHVLTDSNRGATKQLFTNSTVAETSLTDVLTSFNSNGFSLASDANNIVNNAATTYVSWQWKASNAAAVTNTSGSTTAQVSANPTAGFSIVTYTGTGANATVGHGLGIAPTFMIIKARTAANGWGVYHGSLGANSYLELDLTAAAGTGTTPWNNTAPTSSVFTVGTWPSVNANTINYVAYLFAQIEGFSRFGTYTGNGSADGVFVFLGFRPRWVMFKSTSTGGVGYGWSIYDTSRDPYNQDINPLNANSAAAESTTASFAIDLVSNGIKLRGLNQNINQSAVTYIYAAFAENPFQYALAR